MASAYIQFTFCSHCGKCDDTDIFVAVPATVRSKEDLPSLEDEE